VSGKAKPWSLQTVQDRCDIDTDIGGHWVWRFATTSKHKGPQACIEGKTGSLVARWLMQHLGHDITGKAVVPTCCEPLCLNPAHLKVITKGAVLRKAYATGLRSVESEHFSRRRRAEQSGLAKIDMPTARVLRARMIAGDPISALSKETGLAHSTLRDIQIGKSWREMKSAASVFSWRP
jgi:lambda repressor-like predicted transcriptional regulator